MEQKELAQRVASGVEVTLYWRPETDTLAVVVHDETSGEQFELAVDGREALDAYEHPYAYAAFRGVELAEAA